MPYTAEEQDRVSKAQQALVDASSPSGDLTNPEFILKMFDRLVRLRDFAQNQVDLNKELLDRLEQVEFRTRINRNDAAQAYLSLTPS